jgi:tetratricopeptide (TPR) repeat protein
LSRIAVRAGCAATALGLVVYFWSDVCLWRADACLIQRNHPAAATWVKRSQWFRRETDARTCLMQIRIARRRQDFREVEHKLHEAVQLGAPGLEVQRERLLAMAQTNQFAAMQGQWALLLSQQRDDGPDIARAYYSWSMLNHNLDQAEKVLKLWHQDEPRDAEPMFLLGRFYEAQANWAGAEDSYRSAFALAPGNDEYRLALANALQVRLKTDEAVPIYEDYLRQHPDNLVALRGLALCRAADGDLQTALPLLRQALRGKPDDLETQKAYGELLLTAGDAPAAAEVLEQAHRAVPEYANLAYALARALKACGRVDEAEPLFAFVAESRPRLNELEGLERQLRKEPENLELRMKIAAVTAKYVSRRDAIRWYEALLHVAPDYRPAHAALAGLYQTLGDVELAEYHAGHAAKDARSTHAKP